jgi:AraC-like DNA-binding protein
VAIGLQSEFSVSSDPKEELASYRGTRSVLVYPNTLHHFRDAQGVMAFLYLDPLSRDLERVRALMQEQGNRAAFGLMNEDEIIAALGALWRGEIAWKITRDAVGRVLLGVTREPDPRIKLVIQQIIADPGGRLSAAQLAQGVGLSESRFLHLFTGETGVPLRRYRLWCAMGTALRAIAQGASLTSAALDAGFSSSAHFSAAFREMFGMEPSRLARAALRIIETAAVS